MTSIILLVLNVGIISHCSTKSTQSPFVFIYLSEMQVVKTPTKSTPSKRKSKLEREREESEEIIRSMGGNSVEEGGRRTRSSARGVSAANTPSSAAKKAKVESATPSRRGRQKKGIVDVEEPQVKHYYKAIKYIYI